jgi:formate hydrogenlyase subunit 3/multisubunit Na+/H+ antiporter MnhD subunit
VTTQILLVATLALPVAMLLACLSPGLRARVPDLLALAPLPALATALLAGDGPPLVLDPARQVALALDPPAAMLLGVAALLWCAAGLYARAYMVGRGRGRFAIWWLLTLTGSLGVFIAADLATFYLAFGLVSLAAWGLVVHEGTPSARRAGDIYLVLAVLGEVCLLIAFALLAAAIPGESLAIREAARLLPGSPWQGLTLALLIAGFGLKMGLVPLHVWLPIAHPAAPMPASAALSGVIVKAGVVGLIRFLPVDAALPDWGATLAMVGVLTAYWGVACGITQQNPKTVLAYSTVSQMGLVAAVLGMGLAAAGSAGLTAAFYAAHHILAKGALFLVVGVVAASGVRPWPVLLPAAVLALGFGGLPLSGGYVAKLAVKDTLGEGAVGLLATLAGAGSTLLMLHFLERLRRSAPDSAATAPAGLVVPWLAMALAAIVLPWALFVRAGIGSPAEALAPVALLAALWPVLLGIGLAALLRPWADRLPQVPEGDVVVLVGRAVHAGTVMGAPLNRAEIVLQRWPVGGLALLVLLVVLGATLMGASR